jgi:ribosomal protein S12 methylthiotransferase
VPDLVREAESLIAVGAKEIALVAQDLTVYGRDRGEEGLIPLLDALEPSLPGDVRLRLLYLHPARVGAPLLERIAASPRILRYLDIPIQHADPAILSAMGRPASEAELSLPFETARAIDPDFALRTTCMVGFPGEDARAFAALSRFLERIRFDRVGAFTYWPEEGTRAAALPGQVPGATKTRRMNRLLALQDRISSERGERFVGRVLECLVERVEPAEGWGEGRTFREAPEVDGRVEIRNPRADLRPGERIALRVLLAGEQDLVGEEVEAS